MTGRTERSAPRRYGWRFPCAQQVLIHSAPFLPRDPALPTRFTPPRIAASPAAADGPHVGYERAAPCGPQPSGLPSASGRRHCRRVGGPVGAALGPTSCECSAHLLRLRGASHDVPPCAICPHEAYSQPRRARARRAICLATATLRVRIARAPISVPPTTLSLPPRAA